MSLSELDAWVRAHQVWSTILALVTGGMVASVWHLIAAIGRKFAMKRRLDQAWIDQIELAKPENVHFSDRPGACCCAEHAAGNAHALVCYRHEVALHGESCPHRHLALFRVILDTYTHSTTCVEVEVFRRVRAEFLSRFMSPGTPKLRPSIRLQRIASKRWKCHCLVTP